MVKSLLISVFLLCSAYGATEPNYIKHECCTIKGSGIVNKIFIPPATGREIQSRFTYTLDSETETEVEEPVLTLFQVNYDSNVPEPARVAVNYALLHWQNLITSEVPIEVRVEWITDQEEGTLASASASYYVLNEGDSQLPRHYEPIVIINRKRKYDQIPGLNDIDISVNADASFYYGTDGDCPTYQYDLVSIIMHEVGHGLGFTSTARKLESEDTATGEIQGRLGFSNGAGLPFDYYLEDDSGLALMDSANFANPSIELFQLFTDNRLFFGGPLTKMANQGSHVRLSAPRSWDDGSSVSHLNEGSFYGTNPNALMTPQIGLGEAIHDPGPISMGIFGDVGWDYL